MVAGLSTYIWTQVFKTVSERFVEVFRETVRENPPAAPLVEELEPCIGCMAVPANVRLERRCEPAPAGEPGCSACNCRPMWCIDCMAKW